MTGHPTPMVLSEAFFILYTPFPWSLVTMYGSDHLGLNLPPFLCLSALFSTRTSVPMGTS